MNRPDLSTELAAATNYEETVVPALTHEWAPRVIPAAGIHRGDRVLDVACGTGVLTRAVAEAVGLDGSVAGLEIGIRMALGADGTRVQRMIVREGGVLLVIGLVLGVVGAFFAAGVMRGLLFGVAPHDPSTFIIPALRAARIDPTLTMRSA